MIETNRLLLSTKKGSIISVEHKTGHNESENPRKGVNLGEVPHHLQI